MAKILYAYLRYGATHDVEKLSRRVATGASRIAPGGSGVRPSTIESYGRMITGMVNPPKDAMAVPGCTAVGHVTRGDPWYQVGGSPPEGTYAICRSNDRLIELVSDAVASRTLWYYFDDRVFVASTSQRWIATVIGSFAPNDRVLTWMLAAGTLGPTDGWDCRLRRLQADSKLTVDIERWDTTVTSGKATFSVVDRDIEGHKSVLRDSLRNVFDALEFDYTNWVLPLSGGYDSRAILCMLRHTEGLRAITWGTAASIRDPGSDAAIAARLAKSVGVVHQYFSTDPARISLLDVFERFVAHGEGQTDNISAYLDGFSIWHTLLENQVGGIIRGDEGFGWKDAESDIEARTSVGLRMWDDHINLPDISAIGLNAQELPDFLVRQQDESVCQWRDRLYHQYRIPTLLASLTELKAPFVEIANPLLMPSVIRAIRTLPDELRSEKRLFKKIVDEASPGIPYASSNSIADKNDVFRQRDAADILLRTLHGDAASAIYPQSLIDLISHGMRPEPHKWRKELTVGARRWLRRIAPDSIKSAVRKPTRAPRMDFHGMAFRVFVTCKSHDLLKADAMAGRAVG